MLIYMVGGISYPPHKHDWKDEIYQVVQGGMQFIRHSANSDEVHSFSISAGETYINHDRSFHSITSHLDGCAFLEFTTGPFRPISDILPFVT